MPSPHDGLLVAIGLKPKPQGGTGIPPSVRDRVLGGGGDSSAVPSPAKDPMASADPAYAASEFKCPVCGAGLCAKVSEQENAEDAGTGGEMGMEPKPGMMP